MILSSQSCRIYRLRDHSEWTTESSRGLHGMPYVWQNSGRNHRGPPLLLKPERTGETTSRKNTDNPARYSCLFHCRAIDSVLRYPREKTVSVNNHCNSSIGKNRKQNQTSLRCFRRSPFFPTGKDLSKADLLRFLFLTLELV
jgi:hypothetical protein